MQFTIEIAFGQMNKNRIYDLNEWAAGHERISIGQTHLNNLCGPRDHCCCVFPLLDSDEGPSAMRRCLPLCLANRFGRSRINGQQTKEFKCHSSHATVDSGDQNKTDLFYFRWRFRSQSPRSHARTQNTKNRFFIIVIVVFGFYTMSFDANCPALRLSVSS